MTVTNEAKAVAVIGPVWTLMFIGGAPVAEIAREHGLSIGDKLYPAAEVERLEARVRELECLLLSSGVDSILHSHRCRKCMHPYTPVAGESEDCPLCGHDGATP